MLKTEPIEGHGVVDSNNHCCSPRIFQVGEDLILKINQEMSHSTSIHVPILIRLALNFCAEPVEDETLVDLGWKHGRRNVAQVTEGHWNPVFW